jgi:uncharacterized glyoxalase superfamily protein PhnB
MRDVTGTMQKISAISTDDFQTWRSARARPEAGAASVTEPADQFYGDRNAGIRDPSGNLLWIATHKEEVSPVAMRGRVGALNQE